MRFIKRMIIKLVNWADTDNVPYNIECDKAANNSTRVVHRSKYSTIGSSNAIEGHNNGMNFTVYNATGGKVIQMRAYNPNTDQSRSTLYVITDKEDLGQELGQIITVESLTR